MSSSARSFLAAVEDIDPDLSVFDRFTACRLKDVTMTSLRQIAEEQHISVPTDAAVREVVAHHLGATTPS